MSDVQDTATRPMVMTGFKAAVAYFVLVLGTGFVLGTIRVPFLVPGLGERYAELLEMPILLVVVVMAARFGCRRYGSSIRRTTVKASSCRISRLLVGFAALLMSVAAGLLLAARASKAQVM